MPYEFATENKDFSDYASGRVFYGAPGYPALPVRLVSELFQRCWAIRQQNGLSNPVTIYDPCCGSAYHLSTLAYLHWPKIKTILASDIDADILQVATHNLSLLTETGLQQRRQEIATMQEKYGKLSHTAAAESAQRFGQQLQENLQKHPIKTEIFAADATHSQEIIQGLAGQKIDLVIADVPYGMRSNWQSSHDEFADGESLVEPMLKALHPILVQGAIVAIIANKAQKFTHGDYKRVERFQIGKRRMMLLQMIGFGNNKPLR